MTPTQYPMKTRAEIAARMAQYLQAAGDDAVELRATLAFASTCLFMQRFNDDRSWLLNHRAQIDEQDVQALQALGRRLVDRLTMEGDTLPDITGRTLDALTADAKRHLATVGDRRAFAGRLVAHSSGQTIDEHLEQLALLLTDALVRLAGYDAVIDELHQLRAQAEIEKAKDEQRVAEAVKA